MFRASSYEMMKSCWANDPSLRPTFTELADKLASILDDSNYQQRPKTKQIQSDYYLHDASDGDLNDIYIQLIE